MSLNVQVVISKDTVTPAVAALMEKAKPESLARTIRGPVERFWRDHLKKFPRLPGKFAAFPDTGFGERASRAVRGTAQSDGVLLRCDAQGIRQRYYGGTIRPVRAKVLCFGITPESYGKHPSDFALSGWVSRKDPEMRKRIRLLFAFAKQVTQRPNPAVVPSNDEFTEVAMAALTRSLAPKGGVT